MDDVNSTSSGTQMTLNVSTFPVHDQVLEKNILDPTLSRRHIHICYSREHTVFIVRLANPTI